MFEEENYRQNTRICHDRDFYETDFSNNSRDNGVGDLKFSLNINNTFI